MEGGGSIPLLQTSFNLLSFVRMKKEHFCC